MINHDGVSTLDTLVNSLGLNSACDFLEKSLPEIIQRKNALQLCLRSGDNDKAAVCAQNTLGSIRFFGSGRLETILLQISQNQIDNDADFQRRLSREFESVIRTIKSWLSENRPGLSATDTTCSPPSRVKQ